MFPKQALTTGLTIFKTKWLDNNDNNNRNHHYNYYYYDYEHMALIIYDTILILCILIYLIFMKRPREKNISGGKRWIKHEPLDFV